MVDYQSDEVFPLPRELVWKLLRDHLDDALIARIHPRIKEQHTVSRSDDVTVIDRTIYARGRRLRSQWKVTARPPQGFRWEILSSEGPYAIGSWMENTYSQEEDGTRIRSRGSLKISVLPFFLPQRPVLRRVLDSIDGEDRRYLRG